MAHEPDSLGDADLPPLPPELFEQLLKHLKRGNERGREGLLVAQVFEKYLQWLPFNRSARTLELAEKYLPMFLASLTPGLRAAELRPFHIIEWIEKHATWGNNQRRAVISVITRPINWAAEMGYPGAVKIELNRPSPKRRKGKLTPALWEALLAQVAVSDPFRDLLIFAWESGARPQETRLIERRHLRLEDKRVEIGREEAKGKKRRRVVFLSPRAEAIVRPLAERYETGALFRNTHGSPWTANAISCRFGRLQSKIGVRLAAYDFRHAFATRMLQKTDPATVAGLMGHTTPNMVMNVYQELSSDGEHLRDVMQREGESQ